MKTLNKGLKEWNAVVEALGKGKQSIIIRKNSTRLNKLLLYPTYNYANDDNYLLNFKNKYRNFVSKNALPNEINNKTEIKYFISIENIIEKSSNEILDFDELYIWNRSHVQFYLDGKKGYIWLLRVHRLKEPYFAERHKGMTYVNFNEHVNIEESKPVLNDKKFLQIAKVI